MCHPPAQGLDPGEERKCVPGQPAGGGGSFLQPLPYGLEDAGHLRLLKYSETSSHGAALFLYGRCQDVASGGYRKATRDGTLKLFEAVNKAS